MRKENLKLWIRQLATEIGIDKIGFTHAGDFESLRPQMEAQARKGRLTGFEHANLDERLNPKLLMPEGKSIISIALAYPTELAERPARDKARGVFARSSWGVDYHKILHARLAKLAEAIKSEIPEAEFLPMVDTGALIDVAVAERAGLGFVGKNTLLITEEFGSYVYLGEMITNLELEPDARVPNQCGDCVKCIKACPVDAILEDGNFDGKACLSYITQMKGKVPESSRRKMKNLLYGCDICQAVCPFNAGMNFQFHDEMTPTPDDVMPELEALIKMSNREFRERFGYMAGSWRGKAPIQRNAIYALANIRRVDALPFLKELLERPDLREEIRDAAEWAIEKLNAI